MWTAEAGVFGEKKGESHTVQEWKTTACQRVFFFFFFYNRRWDEVLPDVLNWLLPRVVGLVFPPPTGGENICEDKKKEGRNPKLRSNNKSCH